MSGTFDNSTSWAPVGATPASLSASALNLVAPTTITGVAYGLVLALYCVCMHSLVSKYREGTRRMLNVAMAVYISIMFAWGTVYCAINTERVRLAYVDNVNYPGGPIAYAALTYSSPLTITGAFAFFITAWMNDALLVWRLSILYRGSRFGSHITAFSLVLYLATFALGMVTLIEAVSPNQSLWAPISVKFGKAYYALTVSYTVFITTLMAARILHARRLLISATEQKGHGAQYLSIAAIIIESSALYAVWGIIFLGLYIANHPVQYVFLASLAEIQIIAPLLIIYRVSIGKGWQYNTRDALSREANNQRQTTNGMHSAIVFKSNQAHTAVSVHTDSRTEYEVSEKPDTATDVGITFA